MRTSDRHKGALNAGPTVRGYEHTVETIKLDPVAAQRLDAGFRAIVERLLPEIEVDVRKAIRWSTTLRSYVFYLRNVHQMQWKMIAEHLTFSYGTTLFSDERLMNLAHTEKKAAARGVECGQSATGSSKMRTIRHSIDK